MRRAVWIMVGVCMCQIMTGCGEAVPPVAQIIPHEMEIHGDVRVDNYYWLRERENPEVISYLEAENKYTDAVLKHTSGLQEAIFEEIKGRIVKNDESVPYF